jgi:hypothetical protein
MGPQFTRAAAGVTKSVSSPAKLLRPGVAFRFRAAAPYFHVHHENFLSKCTTFGVCPFFLVEPRSGIDRGFRFWA